MEPGVQAERSFFGSPPGRSFPGVVLRVGTESVATVSQTLLKFEKELGSLRRSRNVLGRQIVVPSYLTLLFLTGVYWDLGYGRLCRRGEEGRLSEEGPIPRFLKCPGPGVHAR